MPKKMTIAELKALYHPLADPIPGDPNLRTSATAKGHIHKVSAVWLPPVGGMTPAEYRYKSKTRTKKATKVVKKSPPYRLLGNKKIACLSGRGCGNIVSEKIGTCRDCRRAGVLKVKRLAYKQSRISKMKKENKKNGKK